MSRLSTMSGARIGRRLRKLDYLRSECEDLDQEIITVMGMLNEIGMVVKERINHFEIASETSESSLFEETSKYIDDKYDVISNIKQILSITLEYDGASLDQIADHLEESFLMEKMTLNPETHELSPLGACKEASKTMEYCSSSAEEKVTSKLEITEKIAQSGDVSAGTKKKKSKHRSKTKKITEAITESSTEHEADNYSPNLNSKLSGINKWEGFDHVTSSEEQKHKLNEDWISNVGCNAIPSESADVASCSANSPHSAQGDLEVQRVFPSEVILPQSSTISEPETTANEPSQKSQATTDIVPDGYSNNYLTYSFPNANKVSKLSNSCMPANHRSLMVNSPTNHIGGENSSLNTTLPSPVNHSNGCEKLSLSRIDPSAIAHVDGEKPTSLIGNLNLPANPVDGGQDPSIIISVPSQTHHVDYEEDSCLSGNVKSLTNHVDGGDGEAETITVSKWDVYGFPRLYYQSKDVQDMILQSQPSQQSTRTTHYWYQLPAYAPITLNIFQKVICVHFNSVNELFCVLLERKDRLDALNARLSAEAEEKSCITHVPKVGEILIGKYYYDDRWYRVKVTDTDVVNKSCEVLFCDYGNPININFENLRLIDSEHLEEPCFAIHCIMNEIRPTTNSDGLAYFIDKCNSTPDLKACKVCVWWHVNQLGRKDNCIIVASEIGQ